MLTAALAAVLLAPVQAPAQPQPPRWVERPFNGRNLEGWVGKPRSGQANWTVGRTSLDAADPGKFVVAPGRGEMINNPPGWGQSWDWYSEARYGDVRLTLEVKVPRGSNSGIYLMGEYEVQVLDSFGRDANPGPGDMGAIYGAQPPKSPKYLAPGEWNRYEIHFRAPRFDSAGKKTENARFVKVVLNGVTIHENVEMPGPTPGGVDGREKPFGPIMFQGDHGAVSYRNIRARRL